MLEVFRINLLLNLCTMKTDTMLLKFTGNLRQYSDNLFIGWIDNIKGLVVEASTKEDVKRELLTSLKVKIAFDYGLEISKIEHQEVVSLEAPKKNIIEEGEQCDTFDLTLA